MSESDKPQTATKVKRWEVRDARGKVWEWSDSRAIAEASARHMTDYRATFGPFVVVPAEAGTP